MKPRGQPGGLIGALSQACSLPVTTAVTCPTTRIHPAVIAQAAATAAAQLEGRFVLGVGTGEALNEHVLGDPWPSADVRLEMLEEAVEVMRQLWTGEVVTAQGTHYDVDTARIYTLPDEPPPVASSPAATSSGTPSSCATTSMRATTRCTSPTWARTTWP